MKNILITGAGGGMGGAAARLFAERGYRVFALDRIESKAEIENIIPIAADLSLSEGVKSAIERVKELTDTLDGIIHFAGAYAMDSLVEMSDEKFEKIFKINLGIAFLVNKEALPLLSAGSKISPFGSAGRSAQILSMGEKVSIISSPADCNALRIEAVSVVENTIPSIPTVSPLARLLMRYSVIDGVSGSPSFIRIMPVLVVADL